MRKTIIGSVLLLSGVISSISILITTSLCLPNVNTWRGNSKLLSAIFYSLDLGIPFVLGIALFAIGVLILGNEYFKKD